MLRLPKCQIKWTFTVAGGDKTTLTARESAKLKGFSVWLENSIMVVKLL